MTSFDDLKSVGKPLKELVNDSNDGFQEFSNFKDILISLKELSKMESFDEFGSLKEEFDPLKDLVKEHHHPDAGPHAPLDNKHHDDRHEGKGEPGKEHRYSDPGPYAPLNPEHDEDPRDKGDQRSDIKLDPNGSKDEQPKHSADGMSDDSKANKEKPFEPIPHKHHEE